MKVAKKKKPLKAWAIKAPDEFKHDVLLASRLTDRTMSSFVRNAVMEELRRMSNERPELKEKFKLLAA